ncbi:MULTISPECIES: hypothetical protein [Plantibacter]|uniref:hypothetical protein n=1 Tax=Plantibacter TaxID=190323 RepID=UPI000F5F3F8C|nr:MULTISPECIES: hypothetical protein [Plantibacter]MBD8467448.1 hypothetical protein [Plantibacter sp. CFBP 8798]MDD9153943.1 hypothetical protein [Plantibacter flavus]
MEQFTVDTALIRDTTANLTVIQSEFDAAEKHTASAADVIPHELLARTLQEFSSGWDTRRSEFSEAITTLNGMGTAIADHFEGWEADQAAAAGGDGDEG